MIVYKTLFVLKIALIQLTKLLTSWPKTFCYQNQMFVTSCNQLVLLPTTSTNLSKQQEGYLSLREEVLSILIKRHVGDLKCLFLPFDSWFQDLFIWREQNLHAPPVLIDTTVCLVIFVHFKICGIQFLYSWGRFFWNFF